MTNPTEAQLIEQIAQVCTFAADDAVLNRQHATMAAAVAAAVREVLTCAHANGLIQLVPAEEWPEEKILYSPYTSFGAPR